MKNKILFLLGATATAVILTLNMSISTNDDGSDLNLNSLVKMASAQGESGGGSTGGCYTTYILDCYNIFGYNTGQTKICEFQNVYGYPYACSELPCVGNRVDHRCVQG
jgi:hypothetical protein